MTAEDEQDDKYLFPKEIRKVMMEMHHDEWSKLKGDDPIRALAVEQAVSSLQSAFPELDQVTLADIFAFIVSSLKGASERGATLSSVLNGFADICSELTDMGWNGLTPGTPPEVIDASTE